MAQQQNIDWSLKSIRTELYRSKFVDVPDIIEEWLLDQGGISGKDVLEFGCGEGTMALSMALRKDARRVVGVELLDVYKHCATNARLELGLQSLPNNLEFGKISAGQGLGQFGEFDLVYSWSVFEHVSQDMLQRALASIKSILKPKGIFFLQISPLYYSAAGSHLAPWIAEPWAHLAMQHEEFHETLSSAGVTPPHVREEWAVYIPRDTDTVSERSLLWQTYVTLNKITAPQLCRLVRQAGFKIDRDYRTKDEIAIPVNLAEVYDHDILITQQIVLKLSHS
jgi:SAM-dependent methyltransferase